MIRRYSSTWSLCVQSRYSVPEVSKPTRTCTVAKRGRGRSDGDVREEWDRRHVDLCWQRGATTWWMTHAWWWNNTESLQRVGDVVCVMCMLPACWPEMRRVVVDSHHIFASPTRRGQNLSTIMKEYLICLIIPSLLSELTHRNKEAAKGQYICHDGVLLMCVETIILMLISRTEVVGDA